MSWAGKGKVAFVGVGYSAIERDTDVPLGAFAEAAIANAIADAGLRSADIDGLATYPAPAYKSGTHRDGFEMVASDYVLANCRVGEVRWYADLNLGMAVGAIVQSALALIAGACSYVLVWRAMHHAKSAPRASAPGARAPGTSAPGAVGGTAAFSAPYGVASPVQWHALQYRRYLERYGADRAKMAALAVASRRHATMNADAYFRGKPMNEADYHRSRMIADPLCLLDCDIPVQGCVALVMTTADRARDLRRRPAYLAGFAMNATPRPPIVDATLVDPHAAGRITTGQLWACAGLGPADMGAAMLYDGFSPSVLYWLESGGFCAEGEALDFIQDGRIAIEGELPVNTFGGSLSQGRLHGMGHAAEAVLQAAGRAGSRQVRRHDAVCAFSGSPMFRGSGIVVTSQP